MRYGAESMEHHGRELDDQDQCEEEHKHQTYRLQLQILFADVNLRNSRVSTIGSDNYN